MRKGSMRQALAFAAIFALILTGISFAQGRQIPLIDHAYAPEWWTTATAALMIGVFFVAGYYMSGELFQLPEAKSMARQEAYELAVSIMLIMFVLASMYAWGVIAGDFTRTTIGGPGSAAAVSGACPEGLKLYPDTPAHPENRMYQSVDWFLGCEPGGMENLTIIQQQYNSKVHTSFYAPIGRGVMLNEMMNQYVSLITLEMLLGPVSTFGVSAFLPEATLTHFDISMAPNAGLGPISEAMIVVTDLVGVGIGTIVMQKLLLQFIHQNVLVIFLPLGLAARGVPFLRKTGSTIIAVCLVLYFIYPLTLWINQGVYFGIQGKLINWANYASLAEICQARAGIGDGDYQDMVANNFQDYMKEGERLGAELTDDGGSGAGGNFLPWSLLKNFWNSFMASFAQVAKYMFWNWGWLTGPILPVNYFFEALVDIITVSMQIFVLNLMFLVTSILFCVTVFKDVSGAIGGEPRIFGLSKLV